MSTTTIETAICKHCRERVVKANDRWWHCLGMFRLCKNRETHAEPQDN